jgi:acyl-CoA synthetase (AMP-forming)/AMP-acid ligase II
MPLFHVGGICYALLGIYAGVPTTFTREPDPASLLAAFAAGVTHTFFVPAVVAGCWLRARRRSPRWAG